MPLRWHHPRCSHRWCALRAPPIPRALRCLGDWWSTSSCLHVTTTGYTSHQTNAPNRHTNPAARSLAAPSWLAPGGLCFTFGAFALGCSPNARGGCSQFPNGAKLSLGSRGGFRNLPRTLPPMADAYRCPVLLCYLGGGVFSPFGLGADLAASSGAGPPSPLEFRACGPPHLSALPPATQESGSDLFSRLAP